MEFLKFISEEFSKRVADSQEYKISAAYTNLALLEPSVSGITYPSVQTECLGANIVLIPDVVDSSVKPKNCSTYILYKKGMKSLIANGEYYCGEIDINKNIQWEINEQEILTTNEEVIKFLTE